jgi:hypothetical protein
VSSQIFVHQLDAIGPMLGGSSAVTALLLSPIAIDLPETNKLTPARLAMAALLCLIFAAGLIPILI